MKNNSPKHIFFIGRLEKEKGVDIVINCIKEAIKTHKNLVFHIFWEWSYISNFADFPEDCVEIHGRVSHKTILSELKNTADIVLMPSRFLETFGLVALEALEQGVPVVGFKKWGLENFIPDALALSEKSPVVDFFQILKKDIPLMDITQFSYENWKNNLKNLCDKDQKILCVHDYSDFVWGAEIYFHRFVQELKDLGKEVQTFSYEKKVSRWKRWFFFFALPFDFIKTRKLRKKIQEFDPDCIISHTILRYIGPNGMREIQKSQKKHMIMHHDLGLVTPYPSRIFHVHELPRSWNWKDWSSCEPRLLRKIWVFYKWLLVRTIWKNMPSNTIHLVPSNFMKGIYQRYTHRSIKTFPHTVWSNNKK